MRSERDLFATVGMAMAPAVGAALLARIHLREVAHHVHWSSPGVANAQVVFLALGCAVGAALALLGPPRLFVAARWVLALTFAGLVVTLGQQDMVHARVAGLVVTPTEFAKAGLLVAVAGALAAEGKARNAGLVATAIVLLMVGARDVMTFVVVLSAGLGAAWIAVPRTPRFAAPLAAVVGIGLAAAGFGAWWMRPYQWARLETWLHGGDPRSGGWIYAQVRAALGASGLAGTGAYPKFADVFEHNDLGLVDLGARFGFGAVVLVLAVHVGVVLFCLHAAVRAEERFGAALATGTAITFAWHGVGNAAMVAGLLPIVNLRLGLVSYGGSSVVALLALLGATTGVALRAGEPDETRKARVHGLRLAFLAVTLLVVVRLGFLMSSG